MPQAIWRFLGYKKIGLIPVMLMHKGIRAFLHKDRDHYRELNEEGSHIILCCFIKDIVDPGTIYYKLLNNWALQLDIWEVVYRFHRFFSKQFYCFGGHTLIHFFLIALNKKIKLM